MFHADQLASTFLSRNEHPIAAILHILRGPFDLPDPGFHRLRYVRRIYYTCYYPSVPRGLASRDHRIRRYETCGFGIGYIVY